MGLADMVPGVSGGTMALITGIYPRFIGALAAFDRALVTGLLRGHWAGAWRRIDGAFLCTLALGVVSAILVASHFVHVILERFPWALWGVFLGLVSGAVLDLARQVPWRATRVIGALVGLTLALLTLAGAGLSLAPAPPVFFLGGAVAVTAMLLPGISGSLLLLMMGLYLPVLEAVRVLDFGILGAVAAGCVMGVLVFSRVIRWLLQRHYSLAIATMTGILVGALPRLWPWQSAAALATGQWLPLPPPDVLGGLSGLGAVMIGGGLYACFARYG